MASPLSLPDVWNDVAAGYADELVPVFSRYARDALRLAALSPRAHVLDVAAGPGTLSFEAAPRVAHVVAVDFSEAMLAVLKARAAAEGLPNVEAVHADGQALPFPDAHFEGYFSMFGLIFFPDRAAGFREAHRVLKPGGRAVVSSWAPLDGVPLLCSCLSLLRDRLPWLPSGEGKAPLGDEQEFRAEMEAAGFDDVEVYTVAHRVDVPSVAAFWASNDRSSAPLALVRRHLDPSEWADVGADVVARLEQAFGTGPVEMRWPARLGVGTRA